MSGQRDALDEAHRFLLDHIRRAGTWWTGAERVAIAATSRAAARCTLCRARKASLSPGALDGTHDDGEGLPAPAVDVAHRIRSDPARLSRAWFERVTSGGLDRGAYVEIVGVTAMTAGLDYYARALGAAPLPLLPPLPGAPSRHRPAGAALDEAWVELIALERATGPEADLYEGAFVPNIVRALSLVPDEVRALKRTISAHYLPLAQIPDPTARRVLDRSQIELVAARVSAVNECFY